MNGHNPDILTCLANLSADEVFTPPKLAAAMLDILPQDLFRRPDTTFLDPACKSGVFLREIASRLNDGLRDQMPDTQARVNHILTKQVFGLAITELTSLLSRRSVYCSKKADGRYSIATAFTVPDGHIRLPKTQHTWSGAGRCELCGANQGEYDRDESLEAYAYPFIHGIDPTEIFNVKFDVIIGNPPYQLGADGGNRDIPIYNKFVDQAKKLDPRFLTMIIPSRWMAGGLGLAEFRHQMLHDRRIRKLVDYPAAGEVFPGVELKGGVCYFLWDRDSEGDCAITTIRGNEAIGPLSRDLGEFDVLVRDSRALSILRKVQSKNEPSITELLSVDKEFGWTSNFDGFRDTRRAGDVPIHYIRKMNRGVGYIDRRAVVKSEHLIDTWKVLVPKAYNGGDGLPHQVLGKPLIAASPSVCTQSFLFFFVHSDNEAQSVQSYYTTRLFRFLVSLRKITQDATRSTYSWVPQQTWNRAWTDDALYAKYSLTADEIAFIESMVRPME
jgi:site-specific DNA-methyltransferase (adenine-specific)